MLGEGKYSPGVEPAWKVGSARFSDFYKALVNKPDPGVHRDLCKVTRSKVCEQGGLACIREGSRVAGRARAYILVTKTDLDARERSRAGMARVQHGGIARMFQHSIPI